MERGDGEACKAWWAPCPMTSRTDARPGARPSQAPETSILSLVVMQEVFLLAERLTMTGPNDA
jgi:hypothetical protein